MGDIIVRVDDVDYVAQGDTGQLVKVVTSADQPPTVIEVGEPGPPGAPGVPGEPGEPGPPGSDANVDAHVAEPNPHPQYLLIEDVGPSLPPGGATGQALRKLSATDGDADWSSHWVVDPVTGAMTEARTYSGLYSGQVPQTFLSATYDTAFTDPGAGTWLTQFRVRFPEGLSYATGRVATGGSSQIGYVNTQFGQDVHQDGAYQFQAASRSTQNYGFSSSQFGDSNTQTGGSHAQFGTENTQSGYGSLQAGGYSTQSGYYNGQVGYSNVQTGDYGSQFGRSLNDGGFDYTAMFGFTKTATVTRRAYFAMDNGIWLKPFAGDAASPENGVVGYNSTLGQFRFYQGGGWKSYLTETDPTFKGMLSRDPLPAFAFDPTYTVRNLVEKIECRTFGDVGGTYTRNFYFERDARGNTMLELTNGTRFNSQLGGMNYQSANASTQSGYSNFQWGNVNTQSGYYNFQFGSSHTQSGNYNHSSGCFNTQSGTYGFQHGFSVRDGGYSHTFMVGDTKLATAEHRAYFAMKNGIWLKPFAGDVASPENGVIGYNSTLGRFRFYQGGAFKSLDVLPTGGTAGQTIRKVDGTDGNAAWSPHWTVDASTGLMSHTFNYANTGSAYQEFVYLQGRINYTATGVDYYSQYKQTAGTNISNTYGVATDIAFDSSQTGFGHLQIGFDVHQSGANNTQSGYVNTQAGANNTQIGVFNTQSGYCNFQYGHSNTQSGFYGFQSGNTLSDGGFNYTAMFGLSKTATVTKRAYFAMDNGIWLKPVAGDPASPENGVIGYNSTLGKFRAYEAGAWKDLIPTTTGGTYDVRDGWLFG